MCPSEHGLATSSFEIPSWFFAAGASRDDILAHVPLNSDSRWRCLSWCRGSTPAPFGCHRALPCTPPHSLLGLCTPDACCCTFWCGRVLPRCLCRRGGFRFNRGAWSAGGSLLRMTCSDLLRCSEDSTCALQAPPTVAFALHWCGPHGEGGYSDRGDFHCSSQSPLVRTTWRGLLLCSDDDISATVSTHLASNNV